MSVVDVIMPKLGESIMEATILKWHKKVGDKIAQDETILDIATDKVDSEVPSTAEGIIEEILFAENDVVPIGTVIVKIRTGAADTTSAPLTNTAAKEEYEEAKIVEEIPFQPTANSVNFESNAVRFYSPLVLNIAQSEGISMTDLEKIPGTGQDGRVSKKDILAFVANRGNVSANNQPAQATQQSQQAVVITNAPAVVAPANNTPVVYSGNVEVIEMDRMRKLISKHMTDSVATSAHVTSFAECDVTNLVQWREKIKKEFEKREGEKITFTPLFIEAVVKSLKNIRCLAAR